MKRVGVRANMRRNFIKTETSTERGEVYYRPVYRGWEQDIAYADRKLAEERLAYLIQSKALGADG